MRLTPHQQLQVAAQKIQAEAAEDGLQISDEAAQAMALLEAQGHLVDLNTGKIIQHGDTQRFNLTQKGQWVAGSN